MDEGISAIGPIVVLVVVVVSVWVIVAIAVRWTRRSAPHSDTAAEAVMPTRRISDDDPPQFGPYRVYDRLGSGGMGRVYLGSSPGGRTVAVKAVHPDLADDPAFRRRFAAEVEAARRVGGFYTAQVVDADPDGDPPWLATAYIPGPSLHEAVRDHGPLPPVSVAALGAGLAEGLMVVHVHRLVHRDLKPGNVILAADGPRVIDFGIARALDATSATRASTVLGTAAFMAPEQVTGDEVGPASDVFALGCVLVYASTGRSPFGEGPAHAVTHRIVYADPDLSGLPASLAHLVGACLAKDPAARPDLERVLTDLSADLRPGRDRGEGRWLPEAVTEVIAQRRTRVLEPEPLRSPPAPAARGAGPKPGRPSRRPAAETASVVLAVLCLLMVPVVPLAAFEAVNFGAITSGSAVVQTVLCTALAAALAIGAALLLARISVGRWLIVAGGAGLALQGANAIAFVSYGLGRGPLIVLYLIVVTAVAAPILAVLPPTSGRRQRPR